MAERSGSICAVTTVPSPGVEITDSSEHYEEPQEQAASPGAKKVEGGWFRLECMKGVITDLKARLPLYKSDWARPESIPRVLNATIFAFVVQLIPALIFAELMQRKTEGSLAVAETLLSAGVVGVLYVFMAGQPLVLLGITGPVAILLGTSYGLAERFEAEYFAFFWWLCMWTALLHVAAAMVGLVNFVWIITPFTSQIFEFFIAMSFIYESIRDLLGPLHLKEAQDESEDRSAQYASLVIGICTFQVCWTLHFAETWVYGPRQFRTFLSSYNMAISVVIMTSSSYLPGINQTATTPHGIERVEVTVPWNWQPSTDRKWVTNPLEGIGAKGIFGALFPAFMLFLLFFIDHNISSILTQAPKYNLKKPPAYHWDIFCLGLTIIPCAILGLPPGSGLIPQAPLHTRALATREIREIHGVQREVTTNVEEQRWSGFGQAALMFMALSLFVVISWIPKACLFGVFLYLGVGAMHGNEIWERITLCAMYEKKRPPIPVVSNVRWRTVQWFTLVQVTCAGLIFGIAQFASIGEYLCAVSTAFPYFCVDTHLHPYCIRLYLSSIGDGSGAFALSSVVPSFCRGGPQAFRSSWRDGR
jgi:hypothetical protein